MSPPTKRFWLSTDKMTVIVEINHMDVIIDAAPVVHRFIGQPFDNLVFWLRTQPGFKMAEMSDEELADFNAGYQ